MIDRHVCHHPEGTSRRGYVLLPLLGLVLLGLTVPVIHAAEPSGQGTLQIERVGPDGTAASAPITTARVDALPAISANPAFQASLAPGTHSIFVTDVPNYVESFSACAYPRGGAECRVPSMPIRADCYGSATCLLKVTLAPGEVTKVVVLYTPSTSPPPPFPTAPRSPSLRVDRASVSFGDQPVATTSPVQRITLTNVSDVPVVPRYGIVGSFTARDQCSYLPIRGGSCTFDIQFRPLIPGPTNGTLSIRTAISGNDTVSVALDGAGLASTAPSPRSVPPLAPDPAAVQTLTALPANSWLAVNPKSHTAYESTVTHIPGLGLCERPITSPDPILRSYSGSAVGGGTIFYFGGAHAGHPGNDVELFHIDANQWEVQYTPECPDSGTILGDALTTGSIAPTFMTSSGRPYVDHTYQYSVYDPVRRRFLAVLTSGTWAFDLETRQWAVLAGPPLKTFSPAMAPAGGMPFYEPDQDKLVLIVMEPRSGSTAQRGVYSFDLTRNVWTFEYTVPSPGFRGLENDVRGAYDPDRKEYVMVLRPYRSGGVARLVRYGYSTNRWTEVGSLPSELKEDRGVSLFDYDTTSHKMVFLRPPKAADATTPARPPQIWMWDVERDTWGALPASTTTPPTMRNTAFWSTFRYDSTRNVFTYVDVPSGAYCSPGLPSGSGGASCGGRTKTWVYRYAGGPGSGPPPPTPLPIPTPPPPVPSPPSGGGRVPLVLSAVTVSDITTDSATISWSSNTASSSQVEYGPTGGFGTLTPLNRAAVTFHSVRLSALTPNTRYYYRARSTDSVGTLGVSQPATFTILTAAPPAPTPPPTPAPPPTPTPPPPAPPPASLQNGIPLTITEPTGIARSNDPVTSGVPLPHGTQVTSWALFDGNIEIPVQVTSLQGRTPWILLDFQATVAAKSAKTLLLKPQASTVAHPRALTITEDESSIVVVTGPLKVAVSKVASTGLGTVWVDRNGDGRYDDSERVVSPPASSLAITDATTGGVFSAGPPTRITWDYNGPIRAVLRMDGKYTDAGGKELLEYTTRVSFYAGRADVKLEHVLRNSVPFNQRDVKIKSATVQLGGGGQRARAVRSGSVSVVSVDARGVTFELIPTTYHLGGAPAALRVPGAADIDPNGGMVLPDLSYHGATLIADFTERADAAALADRTKAWKAPLFALAPSAWYSDFGELSTSRFGTLEDEKETYRKWGWTWKTSQEPSTPHDPEFAAQWGDVDISGDSESDDTWQNLLMYLRTGVRGYLDRGLAWARYYKWEMAYRTDGFPYAWDAWEINQVVVRRPPIPIPLTAADALHVKNARDGRVDVLRYGGAHMWGFGLVDYYHLTGDRDAVDAAIDIAEIVDRMFGKAKSPYVQNSGYRRVARNLMVVIRVYDLTGDPRWKALADHIVTLLLESPAWDERGTYTWLPDKYPKGLTGHHLSDLHRAFDLYYQVTGHPGVRERLIKMAEFAKLYALEPTYMETAKYMYLDVHYPGEIYYDSDFSLVNPFHTVTWIDTLIRGYRLTGDRSFLERARLHWEQTSKSESQRPIYSRVAGPTEVGKFLNVEIERLYFRAAGQLPFADLLFYEYARGGVPADLSPSITFSIDKTSTAFEGSAELSWSTARANACIASGGWSGQRATMGPQSTGPMRTSRNFVLTCTSADGVATRIAHIDVGAAPALPGLGTGIIFYHSFDLSAIDAVGPTDTKTIDRSGQGRNGIMYHPKATIGKIREALQFNGVDDYVKFPAFAYGPDFSLSFWFKSEDNRGNGSSTILYADGTVGAADAHLIVLFAKDGSQSLGLGKLVTQIQGNGDSSASVLEVPAGFGDGAWHLYALTAGSSGAVVYIDGVKQAESGRGTKAMRTGAGIVLGASRQLGVGHFFRGSLDDLRLYGRVLGLSEVENLYRVATGSTEPLLVLTASPSIVPSGSAATLTWATANLTSCAAGGAWSGSRAVSGSERTALLSAAQTYTLTCAGPTGTVTRSVTVAVRAGAATPSAPSRPTSTTAPAAVPPPPAPPAGRPSSSLTPAPARSGELAPATVLAKRANLPQGIAGDEQLVFITEPLNRRVAVVDRATGAEVAELSAPPEGFLLPFELRVPKPGLLVVLDAGRVADPSVPAVPRVYDYQYRYDQARGTFSASIGRTVRFDGIPISFSEDVEVIKGGRYVVSDSGIGALWVIEPNGVIVPGVVPASLTREDAIPALAPCRVRRTADTVGGRPFQLAGDFAPGVGSLASRGGYLYFSGTCPGGVSRVPLAVFDDSRLPYERAADIEVISPPPPAGDFDALKGLTFNPWEPSDEALYAADPFHLRLVRIDVATGQRTVIADNPQLFNFSVSVKFLPPLDDRPTLVVSSNQEQNFADLNAALQGVDMFQLPFLITEVRIPPSGGAR